MKGYYSTSSRRETKTLTTLPLASASFFSYYNPCYCFEVAIRVFLKYSLGIGRSSTKEEEDDEEEEMKKNQSSTQDVDDDPPPPTSTETGKQKIEDVIGVDVVDRGMRSKGLVRFPQRPRIRSGRPGQIN